jgi:phospholipid/cholesterol/gamma-HCH transport system substrate-binding protein
MKKEFAVGLFLFIGLLIFGLSIFVIKDIRLQKGYRLNLYFDNIGNLAERAWVRMRGVNIGRVEKIDIAEDKAKVVVWIDSKIKLYKTAKAKITSTGVLGVKYVEIIQGEKTSEYFKDGDSIYNTESVVSIDDALSQGIESLKQFADLLSSLSKEKDLSKKLNDIFSNLDELSKKINNSVDEQQVKKTIQNIQVAGENLNTFLTDTKQDVKSAVLTLKNVSEKLDKIVDNISSTQTIVGQIVSDKESAEKFAQTMSSIKLVAEKADKTLNRINMFTTYWDYRFRYDTKNNVAKNDIGIEVYPRQTKFYYLAVNNISLEDEFSEEKNNTVSIGIGGTFYDKITVYGGLIRSYGGVGMRLFPLGYKSKLLEFGVETYNFSKSRSAPQVDLSAKLKLTRWLYIGTRCEDVATESKVNTMLNITFEDEDIAYLLGLIGLTW